MDQDTYFHLVLTGPPGSGKGTQAKKLCAETALLHISTGDLLREAIKAQTPLGRMAQQCIDKGNFVPDDTAIELVEAQLAKANGVAGCVYDGFPRNVAQARVFDAMLRRRNEQLGAMVLLDVPGEVLVQRLLARGSESNRPDDQEESIIRKRLAIYHETTEPIIGYYEAQGKLIRIDGNRDVAAVNQELCNLINTY